MKVVDCTWELANLGKHVCEITVCAEDKFNKESLLSHTNGFEYAVVKVPMNHIGFNFGLSNMGFTIIETQINISKKYRDFDFNDRLVKHLSPFVNEEVILSDNDLEEILVKITPGMFSTDRIYLDPHFEIGMSSHRYKNWIKTEYERNTSTIKKIFYEDKLVGFVMERLNNGVLTGLLGGIFEGEQTEGLGFLTACASYVIAQKRKMPFKLGRTTISSNNIPMLQIYNYLKFRIDSMSYVFVKHQ